MIVIIETQNLEIKILVYAIIDLLKISFFINRQFKPLRSLNFQPSDLP